MIADGLLAAQPLTLIAQALVALGATLPLGLLRLAGLLT